MVVAGGDRKWLVVVGGSGCSGWWCNFYVVVVVLMLNQLKLSKEGGVVIGKRGIDRIKLLSANKGQLKKKEHNLTT